MPFPLTEEQKKIVDDRGGELLVSAAAGSGKTRVLVERLLDRVTKEGLDIDRFLVITYTKAAAAELRGRIAQELSDRLAANPQRPQPPPSDHPGLPDPDIHRPLLLRRPPPGERSPAGPGPRLPPVRRGGGPRPHGPGAGGGAGQAV